MTFRKVDIIFVVLALLVVGGVALLPSPRDRNPKVPANSGHQADRGREPVSGLPCADRRSSLTGAASQAAGLPALPRARARVMEGRRSSSVVRLLYRNSVADS
ncbi:MAG: hypothetical protein IPO99_03950 [Nitrospira sp.]|nr:hypothetical protein [Nitrospira sp.]